jgi:hypothetical protein
MHSRPGHKRILPTARSLGKQFARRTASQRPFCKIDIALRNMTCYLERAAHFPMKTFLSVAFIVVLLAAPMAAQAPDAQNEQRLLALLKEVQIQQAQMAENQGKIEAKLADLTETIRVARIFAGRAGK